MRNADACFTLLESGTGDNLTAGDQIRHWSRIRVHRDFFPHYLDQPLLFPSREGGPGKPPNWPKGHLDYILLSALSCSPSANSRSGCGARGIFESARSILPPHEASRSLSGRPCDGRFPDKRR